MANLVPEEKRILMGDFPVRPADVLVAMMECKECCIEKTALGEVQAVFSKNPDPGVAIELRTLQEFGEHVGGIHASVRLSRYDSMWATVLFVKSCCLKLEPKVFYTYELVEAMSKNELAKLGSDQFFPMFLSFILSFTKFPVR